MKAIRVVAVGLMLAVTLIVLFGQQFLQTWLTSTTLNAWMLAINSISPAVGGVAGTHAITAAALVIASIGGGLYLSALIYGPIDDALFARRFPPLSVNGMKEKRDSGQMRAQD